MGSVERDGAWRTCRVAEPSNWPALLSAPITGCTAAMFAADRWTARGCRGLGTALPAGRRRAAAASGSTNKAPQRLGAPLDAVRLRTFESGVHGADGARHAVAGPAGPSTHPVCAHVHSCSGLVSRDAANVYRPDCGASGMSGIDHRPPPVPFMPRARLLSCAATASSAAGMRHFQCSRLPHEHGV